MLAKYAFKVAVGRDCLLLRILLIVLEISLRPEWSLHHGIRSTCHPTHCTHVIFELFFLPHIHLALCLLRKGSSSINESLILMTVGYEDNLIMLTVRRLGFRGFLATIEVSVIFKEMVIDSKMGWVDRFEIDLELPELEKVLATIATNH